MTDFAPAPEIKRPGPWWRPTLILWSAVLVLHFVFSSYGWLRSFYAFPELYTSSWDVLASSSSVCFLLLIGSLLSLYGAARSDLHAPLAFLIVIVSSLTA